MKLIMESWRGYLNEASTPPLYFLGEEINPRTLLEIELQEQGSGNPLRHLNISDNLTDIVDNKVEEEFYTYLKGYFRANQKDPNEEVPANWINKKFRDWLVKKFEGYTIVGPVSDKLLPNEPD